MTKGVDRGTKGNLKTPNKNDATRPPLRRTSPNQNLAARSPNRRIRASSSRNNGRRGRGESTTRMSSRQGLVGSRNNVANTANTATSRTRGLLRRVTDLLANVSRVRIQRFVTAGLAALPRTSTVATAVRWAGTIGIPATGAAILLLHLIYALRCGHPRNQGATGQPTPGGLPMTPLPTRYGPVDFSTTSNYPSETAAFQALQVLPVSLVPTLESLINSYFLPTCVPMGIGSPEFISALLEFLPPR